MTKLTAAARATLAILTPADLAQLEHIRLRRGSGVSAYLDGYRAGLERAAKAAGDPVNIWWGMIRGTTV
jgi:hypothetical protein